MPPEKKEPSSLPRLRESNRSIEAAYLDFAGRNGAMEYMATMGPAADAVFNTLNTREFLSHEWKMPNGKITHLYALALRHGHRDWARGIEKTMEQDQSETGKKLLVAMYNTRTPDGVMPIRYFLNRPNSENWDQVAKMVTRGASLENIDSKGGNLLHYLANSPEPVPESVTQALNGRLQADREGMTKLLAQQAAAPQTINRSNFREIDKAFTPAHLVRNAGMLSWIISVNPDIMKKKANMPLENASIIEITPTEMILKSFSPNDHCLPRPGFIPNDSVSDKTLIETARGPASIPQIVAMTEILLDRNMVDKAQIPSLQSAYDGILNAPCDHCLPSLRKIHTRISQKTTGKPQAKGEFENGYLKGVAHSVLAAKDDFIQVIKDGGDVNDITYNSGGGMQSNALYNAISKHATSADLSFLLNLATPGKDGKTVTVNPDPGLFALPAIKRPTVNENYDEKTRVLQLLQKKGVKVTRNRAGETPLIAAISGHDPQTVELLFSAGLITDKPLDTPANKKAALQELRSYLSSLKAADWNSSIFKQIETMQQLIDNEEKKITAPDPTKPHTSLLDPRHWPDYPMAAASAAEIVSPVQSIRVSQPAQALVPPKKAYGSLA